MKGLLSTRLVSRLAALTVLTTVLAGCNTSQTNEHPFLPGAHGISNASVQFLNASPSEIRRQQRLAHSPQAHHRIQARFPEAPLAVN
jgi:hypothetical protein